MTNRPVDPRRDAAEQEARVLANHVQLVRVVLKLAKTKPAMVRLKQK